MSKIKKNVTVEEITDKRFFSVNYLVENLGWTKGFIEGILEQRGHSFYTLSNKKLIVSALDLKDAMLALNLSTDLLDNV